MPDPTDSNGLEGQDLAEVFDEENITPDGRDIATSDMQRDVYDLTRVEEDADAALEPQDDFDPDRADEAELEEIVMADEDLDNPRRIGRDDEDLVAADDLQPEDMESEALADDDIEALGYGPGESPRRFESEIEARLDHALEETFPASDPPAVTPRRR